MGNIREKIYNFGPVPFFLFFYSLFALFFIHLSECVLHLSIRMSLPSPVRIYPRRK